MKILQVIPTYYPAVRYGGPIFAAHGMARGLAARGHDVEVFTTNIDGAGHSGVSLQAPALLDGVKISYFACNHLRRLYWSPTLGDAVNRDMSHFDIMHLHSVFLWPTWSAARVAARTGIPYVVSPHGMLIKELIRRRSRFAKTVWINLIERTTLRQAAAIHVSSEVEGEELRRFGWKLPQIVTIGYGVEEPEGAAYGEVSDDVRIVSRRQPFILFLGRISWKKGLDRLLTALSLTKAGYLVIAGTDDEGLSPRLARQAEALGISGRVTILARTVDGADKEHLFAMAQLFVLPSCSENFGIAVLEAMWRGLPVIATPEVGAAEIVRKAEAGVIVAADARPLGQALSTLIANGELARKMGEAGRQYVQHRYGWSTIAEEMEGLYRAIVEN